MSSELLATKLYIPQLRSNLIPRPQLIRRLNASKGGNMTLVSAPAGFGKTSLVSVWAHQSDEPVVWLSLEEDDNDLVTFLTYLLAALKTIDEHIGAAVLDALESSQRPQTEALLTILVNEIARVEHQFILILDDCHLITNPSILDALEFIINHLPPQMHLVMITRVDLPIPYSRLRAGGKLAEIRSNDLRFSEVETWAFLNDLMGLDLSEDDVRALEKRTEGWIVGLQLAALSLQKRQNKHEFVAEFSGSHHYIIDYLLEEVLSRQPEKIRSFLCRTAILDHLAADLCNAVLQIKSSRQILRALVDTNLFLIPLDDQRRWYRYHHLFADFLKQCLEEDSPTQIAELHLRASKWYEQQGLISKAVGHALAAGDHTEAGRLIEKSAAHMFEKSELAALMKLVDMLPEAEVIARPWLCIYHTWALRLSGRPYDVVESRLADAERALEMYRSRPPEERPGQADSLREDHASGLQCHIKALKSFQALFREDIPEVMELALQVQACCPGDTFLGSSTAFALGWAHRFSGDLKTANKAFSDATVKAFSVGNVYFAVASQCRAAYALVLAGKLGGAMDSFKDAVKMATTPEKRLLPVAGYAQVYMGGLYYERNDLKSAERYLVEGVRQCERVGYFMDQAVGCVYLARLRMAQEDWSGAREAVRSAEQLSKKMKGYLYVQRWVDDGLVRLWLAKGRQDIIECWIQESGLAIDDDLDFKRDLEHIILARALIGHGPDQLQRKSIQDALNLLERLLEMAETAGWTGKAIEILVLKTKAHQILGEHEAAMNALERALQQGAPERYMRTFLDEGPTMASVLRTAARKGIFPAYTRMLLKNVEADMSAPRRPSEMGSRIDPLSQRELEVLKLLNTDLSGPEIARELSIALTTVRYHTRNIYSKLDSHSRRVAIRKAKDIGLI